MRFFISMRKKNTERRLAEKLVELLQQAVESEQIFVTCVPQEPDDGRRRAWRVPGMEGQTRFPREKSGAKEPE